MPSSLRKRPLQSSIPRQELNEQCDARPSSSKRQRVQLFRAPSSDALDLEADSSAEGFTAVLDRATNGTPVLSASPVRLASASVADHARRPSLYFEPSPAGQAAKSALSTYNRGRETDLEKRLIAMMDAKLSEHKTKCEDLETKLSEHKTKCEDLETKINTLQDEHDREKRDLATLSYAKVPALLIDTVSYLHFRYEEEAPPSSKPRRSANPSFDNTMRSAQNFATRNKQMPALLARITPLATTGRDLRNESAHLANDPHRLLDQLEAASRVYAGSDEAGPLLAAAKLVRLALPTQNEGGGATNAVGYALRPRKPSSDTRAARGDESARGKPRGRR